MWQRTVDYRKLKGGSLRRRCYFQTWHRLWSETKWPRALVLQLWADLLLREGCWDAINMDGGGSTSLVIYDRERNRPLMLNHHANGYVRKTALNLGLIFPAKGETVLEVP